MERGSGNFRAAPILKFSEDKEDRCGSSNFYKLPQELMDAVMAGLSGNCLNQLKLMVLLIGTKEGFRLSEDYVLQHLHISEQSYLRARKALEEKGWITLKRDSPRTLTLNIDVIWEQYYNILRGED